MSSRTGKKGLCPGCGEEEEGKLGWEVSLLLPGGGLESALVCGACDARVLSLVTPTPARTTLGVLRPFALHLRRLARAYELNGDLRHVGLEQAAGILESGRAVGGGPLVDLSPSHPELVKKNGARGLPLAKPEAAPAAPAKKAKKESAIMASVSQGAVEKPEMDRSLSEPARAILTVLERDQALPLSVMAFRTGYREGTGAFNVALAQLRRDEHVWEEAHRIAVTRAGEDALDEFGRAEDLAVGGDLVTRLAEQLATRKAGGVGSVMLTTLASAYEEGSALTPVLLGERMGYKPGTGAFNVALAQLRKRKMIAKRGLGLTPAFVEACGLRMNSKASGIVSRGAEGRTS